MDTGIVFDHVWKKFRRGEVHDSLRDLIPAAARRLTRRAGPSPDEITGREFWALRDVSFDVRPGEALGIIGANGAGKSTVLKMLNRILRPTRGCIEVRGRAGALIEVSAGFHQDLTGRENLFLQGSIMGMRKDEIARKFDRIVEFAGVGDFIDTPVKRYSSGMNARLGFSIAAHLDPDVLIIDEVLAVGDYSFQDRAFGRIKDMVRSGIPVVIVSHQLDRIASLCTKALVLKQGAVLAEGSPQDCIAEYIHNAAVTPEHDVDTPVLIDSVALVDEHVVRPGEWITLRVAGRVLRPLPPTCEPLAVRVRSVQWGDAIIYELGSRMRDIAGRPVGPWSAEIDLQLNVGPGVYRFDVLAIDRATNAELTTGARTFVRVTEGSQAFDGVVQFNGAMRMLAPVDASVGEGVGVPVGRN